MTETTAHILPMPVLPRCSRCGMAQPGIPATGVCADCTHIERTADPVYLLKEAMKFVACLSDGEADACWRDFIAGIDYSSEAVNAYGGTAEVVKQARRFLQQNERLALPVSVRWSYPVSCRFCWNDINPFDIYYRQAVRSDELNEWMHVGCLLADAMHPDVDVHDDANIVIREFVDECMDRGY